MGLDLFVRTMTGSDELRSCFKMASLCRWNKEDVHIHLLPDMGIREARLYAEEHAQSAIYIFNDDDVMPWGKNWLSRGIWAMERNPEFALASSRSVIHEERGNYEIPQGVEIMDVPCVGAPLWVRKGIIKDDLPEFLFVEECIVLDGYMKKRGNRTGIIAGLKHFHLGYGFATRQDLVRGY